MQIMRNNGTVVNQVTLDESVFHRYITRNTRKLKKLTLIRSSNKQRLEYNHHIHSRNATMGLTFYACN